VRTGLRKASTVDTFSKRPPSIQGSPSCTFALTCQIEAICSVIDVANACAGPSYREVRHDR
jgi:hypothetical protein